MNSKIIFSLSIFLSSLIIFSGCKKKNETILGPEYGAAPADFSVVNNKFDAYNIVKTSGFTSGIPTKAVNIQTNHQYYKTTFSHKVGWKLTISSWKSNAKKVFSGYSDFIDETNAKWDGGSSNDYFFGYNTTNDSAEVKLTFTGSSFYIRDTIKLTSMKNYHMEIFNGVSHYLVDDFEGTNPAGTFSSFYIDQQDIGGGNEGNNAYNLVKCQGNFSYKMRGIDINNNTYLGSCNTPTLNDIPANTFKETDPNKMFVNLYIFGTGRPNTTVSVIAYENDAEHGVGVSLNQTINDKLIYQIAVDWTGWKLYSFKYSAFRKPNSGGGLGNNRLNPERLSGLAMELDSYSAPGFDVEAYVDMVVVTENGTFQK